MKTYLRNTRSAGKSLLVVVSLLMLSAQAATAEGKAKPIDKAVLGYWKHIDDDSGQTQSIFKLFEYQGKLVGKIVKTFSVPSKKAQTVCSECTGSQKNKPIAGLVFFWNFVADDEEANKWVEGKILNPGDGKTYDAELELSPDGKTLKVFGYIRMLVKIGGSSEWKRPTAEEVRGISSS